MSIAGVADIHGIDTPSPLPTPPGYLPLLSEASTPVTPATLQGTSPHSTSSANNNSPRISFRSFTLPLEIGNERDRNSTCTSCPSDESSDPNYRLSANLEERNKKLQSSDSIRTCDGYVELLHDRKTMNTPSFFNTENYRMNDQSNAIISVFTDTEMTQCNKPSSLCRKTVSTGITVSPKKAINRPTSLTVEILSKSIFDEEELLNNRKECEESVDSQNDQKTPREIDLPRRSSLPSITDLDSPMSCEQAMEDLQDSRFVICDNANKIFTNEEIVPRTMHNHPPVSDDWIIIATTTDSVTMPIDDTTSVNDSFLQSDINTTSDITKVESMSTDISGTTIDLTLLNSPVDRTSTFRIDVNSDLTKSNRTLTQQNDKMILDVTNTKKYTTSKRERKEIDFLTSFDLAKKSDSVEDDLKNNTHSQLRDQENGNQYPYNIEAIDIHSSHQSNPKEQQVCTHYAKSDNVNLFGRNQNKEYETKEIFRETENLESCQRLSTDMNIRQQGAPRALHITNHQRFSNKSEDNQETTGSTIQQHDRDHDYDHCSNGLSKKCQSFRNNNSQEQQLSTQQHKCTSKNSNNENDECMNLQANEIRHDIEVRIPSENAAEPCEVAHVPEGGASETMERTLDNSNTCSNISSSQTIDNAVVLRDTAAILQELALQRLSGGIVGDMSASMRRKYESETNRRSFDSEIGREIVRERKMRQELDYARGKSDESSLTAHLPPCLRARHARTTRAALSRSLDEAKFNRMTSESSLLSVKQISDDIQHCSTPNVGIESSNTCSSASEKIQLKNLGCLDLGDPQCRERIEKYKEERRTFLRDKYRSESFRGISSKTEDDSEQALLARLKQRASRPSLH